MMIGHSKDQVKFRCQFPFDYVWLALVVVKAGAGLHQDVADKGVDDREVITHVPEDQTSAGEDSD